MLRTIIDEDIHGVLEENMKKLGLDLRLASQHESVTKNADGSLRVTLKGGDTIDADKVLVAIGRPPNVEPLCL